jgi:DNA-binding transcriptional ArsR family regulator
MELHGYIPSAPHSLDATFAALADPTRRAILSRLASGEASVNELAEPFEMSQPAISKHLRVLERAGLISRGREAQRRPRRLEAAPLAEAVGYLEKYREFWEATYQRLDALLDEMKASEKKRTASVDLSAAHPIRSKGTKRRPHRAQTPIKRKGKIQ